MTSNYRDGGTCFIKIEEYLTSWMIQQIFRTSEDEETNEGLNEGDKRSKQVSEMSKKTMLKINAQEILKWIEMEIYRHETSTKEKTQKVCDWILFLILSVLHPKSVNNSQISPVKELLF